MTTIPEKPGVMVLSRRRAFTHVEPLDAFRQHNDAAERPGRNQSRCSLPGQPLEPHQQRQLSVCAYGKVERVADKVLETERSVGWPTFLPSIPIGWIRHHRAASRGKRSAVVEVDATTAKPPIDQVGSHHLLARTFQHTCHCAVATARLPHGSAQRHMLQQSLRNPVRRRVEIIRLAVMVGDMDRSESRRWPCNGVILVAGPFRSCCHFHPVIEPACFTSTMHNATRPPARRSCCRRRRSAAA